MSGRHAKGHKLTGFSAFSRVLQAGRSMKSGPIRIVWTSSPQGIKDQRIGFAVSRSVRTSAAKNRVKRQMKEAVRLNETALGAAGMGHDIVFLFVGGSDGRKHWRMKEIESSVVTLLKKLEESQAQP